MILSLPSSCNFLNHRGLLIRLLKQPGRFEFRFDDKEITEINKTNSAYRIRTTEEVFIEQTYNLVEKGKIANSTTWVTSATCQRHLTSFTVFLSTM